MNQQGPLTFVRLYVAAGIGIKCNFESDQSRQKRISHPSRRLNCEDINFHGRADIFSSCKDSYIRWGGFPPTSIATIFPTFGSLSWSWPISYIFCEGSIMNYAGYIYGKNIDARTWWILRNWIWTRVFGRSPGQRLTVTMTLFCFFLRSLFRRTTSSWKAFFPLAALLSRDSQTHVFLFGDWELGTIWNERESFLPIEM